MMFGACGHKVDAEIAPEYARVYCSLVNQEAKKGGKATLMDAQRKLCRNCNAQGLEPGSPPDYAGHASHRDTEAAGKVPTLPISPSAAFQKGRT